MDKYKELYFNLFNATTKAIEILVTAQQACEERLLETDENSIITIFKEKTDRKAK